MSVRYRIVGTAGHIDHGKSALVEALTGVHPDRLKEEKLRGITIDLGFADFEAAPDRIVSFVDVPGHERFVRHMVAGAAGVDAVLLVVAADEGVMPQTREHVHVCSLLGVTRGIVALTKVDLVDTDLREVVALEIGEFLLGSFLEGAPIVAVSSRTGEGLPRLRETLAGLFDDVADRPSTGIARLAVDRAFVMRGFGTVVTGTLVSGALEEGAEVEILPGWRRARIRGLQVHRRKVDRAAAGQRVAVNLQGVDVEDVPRGSTVTLPGGLVTTRRLWARLRWLPGAPEAVRRGGPVRFHQGTCERAARVRVLGPAGDGHDRAVIVLGRETVLLPGDRFILRRPAPVDTIGGGIVIDARPPRLRTAEARSAMASLERADAGLVARLVPSAMSGRDAQEVGAELGLSAAELDAQVREAEAVGRLVRVGQTLFDADAWSNAERQALLVLERFHEQEPLRPGMLREDLRARAARSVPPDAWRAMLERLERAGRIRLIADRVASSGHEVRLSDDDLALARRIEARFEEAGLDPPEPSGLVAGEAAERAARIIDWLVDRGRLVRIRDGRLFHGPALERLRRKLREYAKISATIDVATFKDLAGVTRKNAIPLLEQLDAERLTRRVGNIREILAD